MNAKAATTPDESGAGSTSTNSDSNPAGRVSEEELGIVRGRSVIRHASGAMLQEGKGKGRGLHVREAAFGHSLSQSPSPWKGLEDEWRGVLSFEGLNELVGLWP